MTLTQRELIRNALSESERVAFDAALEAEGLDDEIALLRVRLIERFREQATDPKVLNTLMTALVRAVAARYRMSPKQAESLAENVAGVLQRAHDIMNSADR